MSYERTVLVGILTREQPEDKLKEYLDELEFLTYTAGGEVVGRFVQRVDTPNPKTFVGSGKIAEIEGFVKENDVGAVIFDDELSPVQQRNIEKQLRVKILDRTGLILDILPAGHHQLCPYTGRTRPVRIPFAKPYRAVDPPGAATRGNRDARPGGNGNRNRPEDRSRPYIPSQEETQEN